MKTKQDENDFKATLRKIFQPGARRHTTTLVRKMWFF
jgi:hypothetical protein